MLKRFFIFMTIFSFLGISITYAAAPYQQSNQGYQQTQKNERYATEFKPASHRLSLGGLASEAMTPVKLITKALEDIAIIGGVGFLFAALIQYNEHRRNPSQVRLSRPIWYLVFGVALILFPFVGYLTTYHPTMI